MEQPSTIPSRDRKAARKENRAAALALVSDPLLNAAEAAAENAAAISTFWRDVKRGTLPAALLRDAACSALAPLRAARRR